ncbi:MAG: HEPN domain-containing protein [Clostridiales bacterium]|jgi:HEPN domain-containing protein|nr:HEPN domain-containing protein [Clostridiales bacterium]
MRSTKHGSDSRKYFDWLEIAARDLLAARILIERKQCLDIAGFHCQQCIEKALKAYLIDRTGTLVDGHNLTWLCRQAARHNTYFKHYMEETAKMNRLYIETRYPSDIDLHLNSESIGKIYDTAKELYEFVCDEVYDGEADEDD